MDVCVEVLIKNIFFLFAFTLFFFLMNVVECIASSKNLGRI